MEKANVIKALQACITGDCEACPYRLEVDCDSAMCNDATALLNASEAPKANPKYTRIEVYTKKGNLLDYFLHTNKIYCKTQEEYNRMHAYYAKEREIQLIAMYRWEKGKLFCKIKCPINPMPTNKEFEAKSSAAVFRFLVVNGWAFKQDINTHMFE